MISLSLTLSTSHCISLLFLPVPTFLSLFLCLSLHPSLSSSLSIFLSPCVSLCLCVFLSLCLCLSFCLPVSPSVPLSPSAPVVRGGGAPRPGGVPHVPAAERRPGPDAGAGGLPWRWPAGGAGGEAVSHRPTLSAWGWVGHQFPWSNNKGGAIGSILLCHVTTKQRKTQPKDNNNTTVYAHLYRAVSIDESKA